eukprot:14872610-Alexandrium_andersonii.AAC.1
MQQRSSPAPSLCSRMPASLVGRPGNVDLPSVADGGLPPCSSGEVQRPGQTGRCRGGAPLQ